MTEMAPPFLDAGATKRDGLAFVGLSLTKSDQEHWELNKIQDRNYEYVATTNGNQYNLHHFHLISNPHKFISSNQDDGWLVGGGEEDEESFKLQNPDSAHIEIMRVGTFNPKFGGCSKDEIKTKLKNILIPPMELTPISVVKNNDAPPELEIRFDMIADPDVPIYKWKNWQLQFVKNQLFKQFDFPARFVPGPFHMTIVRKCTFRSSRHEKEYFEGVNRVLEEWIEMGPKPLNKLCLFKHRNEVIEDFLPNFFGPYDTDENIAIINAVLGDHAD